MQVNGILRWTGAPTATDSGGARGEGVRQVSHPAFVEALGRIATGVTVVSSVDPGAEPGGGGKSGWVAQTVSAMCSVSVDPPLILVCINRRSPINAVIERSRVFCVSALATQHDHVADTFAGRPWPGKD